MNIPVIHIDNVSKLYRLGQVGTKYLSHDLNRLWHRMRGKEDPYLKIGQSNVRDAKGSSEYVWALNGIDLEVLQGEVLGIIGKNGAGKSTLLKILSRITTPTTGHVRIKGRIASLLEVGTGFHPELTGRENIYLNGSILGMRRHEINRRLDEIIDFSGCELYIDTPVKRYSSGMYVRLAFAVAAHLDPEIMVFDEVLAVGDAQFQRKSIGKMGDVAASGRTVLFVSHNMAMIQRLCEKVLLLDNGVPSAYGSTADVIGKYLSDGTKYAEQHWSAATGTPGDDIARLISVRVLDHANNVANQIDIRCEVMIEVVYERLRPDARTTAIIQFVNEAGTILFSTNDFNSNRWKHHGAKIGRFISTLVIPGNFLAEGVISVSCAIGSYNPNIVHAIVHDAVVFGVVDNTQGEGARGEYAGGAWPGVIRPKFQWNVDITSLQ